MTDIHPTVATTSAGGRTDGRRLVLRSVQPLNAEAPVEELSRAGTTPTDLFFIRTHGPVPQVDPATYRLTVNGGVRTALSLELDGLTGRFSRAVVRATVACAGNRRSELRPVPAGLPWGPGAVGTLVGRVQVV